MLKAFIFRHKFLLLTFVSFVFLRLPSLFEPYWYGDEGIYLVLGQGIREGLTLYSQIHDNKPPTLYYFAAISQTVFGFRLLLAIFMAGAIYYFKLLSKKLLPARLSLVSCFLFLILTSIPLIEGNIANAEAFMLLPTIAGIYCFLFSNSRFRFLVSGLLLGLAFTIKIPVAVEFVFLFLWYLFSLKKNLRSMIYDLSSFTLSFFLPFVIYLIYFSLKGTFSDFMFAAILQNFGYLSSWQTGSHSGATSNWGLVVRTIILVIFWIFTYLLTIRKHIDRNLSLIIFWFSATIFGALLSTRPYPHYLIQVAPPLTLLIAFLFNSKPLLKARLFVFGLIVCLGFLIFKFHFYAYPVISYYHNFYSHIFDLSSSDYRNHFGASVENTYQISNYIQQNTDPSENIFVWGDAPFIYALSNRLPVGRFTVAYHIVDFNQYQHIYDQLIISFPHTIVYFPQPSRPYPDLDNLIKNYYYPAKLFGDVIIYGRR